MADLGEKFEQALRRQPATDSIVRDDGSATWVTDNLVIVNLGTANQNRLFRNCTCGCGKGCDIVSQIKAVAHGNANKQTYIDLGVTAACLGALASGIARVAWQFIN